MKERHDSMRGWFGHALHAEMRANPDIWLLTGDLGFGMLDGIRDDFPFRYLNPGASEQAMLGAAVGLALGGKIPFVYSITPFLVYRPFEWIRNYLNHEGIPVKLVGSGLDEDYAHDGISHHSCELHQVLAAVPKVKTYFPQSKEEVPGMLFDMVRNNLPCFIGLRR